MNRKGLAGGHDNTGIPVGPDAAANNIDVGDIGEPAEKPAGVEEGPIQELEGLHQAAVEVQPAPADQRIGSVLGDGELGEDVEEDVIGKEGGGIGWGLV